MQCQLAYLIQTLERDNYLEVSLIILIVSERILSRCGTRCVPEPIIKVAALLGLLQKTADHGGAGEIRHLYPDALFRTHAAVEFLHQNIHGGAGLLAVNMPESYSYRLSFIQQSVLSAAEEGQKKGCGEQQGKNCFFMGKTSKTEQTFDKNAKNFVFFSNFFVVCTQNRSFRGQTDFQNCGIRRVYEAPGKGFGIVKNDPWSARGTPFGTEPHARASVLSAAAPSHHPPAAPFPKQEKKEGRNADGAGEENGGLPGRHGFRRRTELPFLLRHLRRAVLRDEAHPGGHRAGGAGDRVGEGGPVAVQPLPGVRPVCLLRHVQRQRRPVSGLRAVGERVPLVRPSLRRTAP